MRSHQSEGILNLKPDLESAMYSLLPISLASMNNVKLLDRFDKKFVFHSSRLPDLIDRSQNFYRILEINTNRLFDYSTQYYDTLLRDMYLMHHNRKIKSV